MFATRPCGGCGIALHPDEKFCPACGVTAPRPGARLLRRSARVALAVERDGGIRVARCGRCRSEVLPGGRYCQMCGAAQPPD